MIKKRFIDLRHEHHFEIFGLAEQASVHPEVVYRMLLGERVPRDYAVMVLMALSRVTGRSYTLDNVDIRLSSINMESFSKSAAFSDLKLSMKPSPHKANS